MLKRYLLAVTTLVLATVAAVAQDAASLTGKYIERSFNSMGYYACQGDIDIAFPEPNVITVKNIQGYGTTITGTVDWATKTIEFPSQKITSGKTLETDDQGNEYQIDIDVMISGDSIPSPVTGKINEDGSITLGGWIGESFFAGYGWDWTYNMDMISTTFVRPNAKMTTQTLSGKTYEYDVNLEYSEDNSKLLVSNFAGKAGILIDVRSNGSITVSPGQYFYFQNFYSGYASLYYPTIKDGKVESINSIRYIRGEADEKQLSIGEWLVCFDLSTTATTDEWLTTNTTITRTDGGKFLFPKPGEYGWVGNGSEEKPYQLSSAEDFKTLASHVASGQYFDGMHFRMTDNIDFTDSDFAGIATGMETTVNSNIRFEGILDGEGHSIKNLHIEQPTVNHIALIGELRGTVMNLTIDASCTFVGNQYVGSIAGDMKTTTDAKLINCRNYASVTGYEAYTGGLVGQMAKDHLMLDCYNAGTITTYNAIVGGLVGYLFRATVRNSQNDGKVQVIDKKIGNNPDLSRCGGIAGVALGATIDNSLNTGEVSALKECGGIVGRVQNTIFDATISNTLNLGWVNCNETNAQGAIIGLIYEDATPVISNAQFDAQKHYDGAVMGGDYEGTVASATSTLISGNVSLPSDYWTQTTGEYPALKTFADNTLYGKYGRRCYVLFAEGENAGKFLTTATLAEGVQASLKLGDVFTIEGNTVLAPESDAVTGEDLLTLTYGDASGKESAAVYSTSVPLRKVSTRVLAGMGSRFAPYIINDADDWLVFARMANLEGNTFASRFIKVTADIDFTDKKYQIPYQSTPYAFEGNLDGNGFTLRGAICELGTHSSPSASKQGIVVSKLSKAGKIQNITVADSKISGYEYIGAIVGESEGTIDNCMTTDDVVVWADNRYAGGLIGVMSGDAVVQNCVNAASVWSESYVGGIAGDGFNCSENALITATTNRGEVKNYREGREGVSFVSGFLPRYKGAITKSHNYGLVETINSYAAGFVNTTYPSTLIQYCVNHGDVTAIADQMVSGDAAGLVNVNDGILKDCGNEGNVTSMINYAGGIVSAAGTDMRNCWNTGRIIAYNVNAGGIAAYTNGGVNFYNCWNTGEVVAGYAQWPATESDNAGGIVGNGGWHLNGCWNAGYIHVDKNPGDDGTPGYDEDFDFTNAGGLVGTGEPMITDCFNVGTVQSKKHTGGLIGQLFYEAEYASITNSYNAGAVLNNGNAYQEYSNHIVGGHNSKDVLETIHVFYDYEADDMEYPDDETSFEKCMLSRSEMTAADGSITTMGKSFSYDAAATYPQLNYFAANANNTSVDADYAEYDKLGRTSHAIATATAVKQANGSYLLSQSDAFNWTAEGAMKIDGSKAVPTSANGKAVLRASADGVSYAKTFEIVLGNGAVPGDANGDGTVNVFDIVAIADYVLNPATTIDTIAADYNNDGVVNVFDIVAISSAILGDH